MTTSTAIWESKRTAQSKEVEELLRRHFERADAYRYNLASIRVRVIDSRFERKSREERDTMVEPYLDQLPMEIQQDIVTLYTFAPSELNQSPQTFREYMLNVEFDDPSPSML